MSDRMLDRHIELITSALHWNPYSLRKHTTCIDVQNVMDWITQEFPGNHRPGPSDFIRVAPPWKNCWMEWNPPGGKDLRYGVLLYSHDVSDSLPDAAQKALQELGIEPPSETRSLLCLMGFVECGRDITPVCGISVPYDPKTGELLNVISLEDGRKAGVIDHIVIGERFEEKPEIASEFSKEIVAVCLMSITFCHCKNVEARKEDTDFKRHNQLRQKKGQPPLIRFHHITIDPMKKTLVSEGGLHEHGDLHRALHICRGHFRTYTEESKLFGRLTGTFWIPMHTRGTVNQGFVHHEYEVKPKTN